MRTHHVGSMSLQASAHTDVALSKDSLRSQSVPLVPPWLPLWGSCHEVTERVTAPSPPLRGTSPIGRGKALIRLALAGDARATFPQGKAGVRIVTGGNSWKGALVYNDIFFQSPPQRKKMPRRAGHLQKTNYCRFSREFRYWRTISATRKTIAWSNCRRSRPVSLRIFSSR